MNNISMTKEVKKIEKEIEEFCCKDNHKHNHSGGHNDAIYGLSVIGALFYFLQNAGTFNEVIIGIVKSIFWPAILMFKLLTYLKI